MNKPCMSVCFKCEHFNISEKDVSYLIEDSEARLKNRCNIVPYHLRFLSKKEYEIPEPCPYKLEHLVYPK